MKLSLNKKLQYFVVVSLLLQSSVGFADEGIKAALKEIDLSLAAKKTVEGCKAIGDTANEFGHLEKENSSAYDALLAGLSERFARGKCLSQVRRIVPYSPPAETTVNRNDTIRWWEGLSDRERNEIAILSHNDEVNRITGVVAKVIVATLQFGDREGEARRAERMREVERMREHDREHQRDMGNRQIEHERREQAREVVASPVTFPSVRETDLDY